jgi:nitroreductase
MRLGVKREHPTVYIDVGTATENMLLAAHVLGLGAGPVTSFNKGAVRVLLNIPDDVDPELIVCLGRSAPRESFHQSKPPEPTRLSTLVHWEHWKAAPDEGSSQKLA